jgi:very-short-patch-repair endonuclease
LLEKTNSPKMVNIEKELQSARKKLLDLTMRNKLLNFRPSKAKSIRVINADPYAVYDALVLQEKSMQFLSQSDELKGNNKPEYHALTLLLEPPAAEPGIEVEPVLFWEAPPKTESPDYQRPNFLQTTLENNTLQNQLFYIYQDSKSVLEELGYSTLYIAAAFLEWTESSVSQETRIAPLILIPVELERSGVRSAFKLRWNGEDISTNISLKEILTQQEIKLPDFETPDAREGVNTYLQKVIDSIKSRPTWHILNSTYLSFFSFTKFIMYKDIDPAAWPEGQSPLAHPLIKAIFGSPPGQPPDQGFQENEVDQKLQSSNLFHVLDADPSQIAVIEDVKSGRNLVVEGPPGTGKSQTIVNIVAELLAAGKSVLFVSEKMAALEVVKNRLDNVGLGDFCLELHSRKSNKKEFLASLERTLYGPSPGPDLSGNDYTELDSLKLDLNRYAEDLWKPFGKVHLSPYMLYHHKEEARCYFEKRQKSLPRIRLGDLNDCDFQAYDTALQKMKELQDVLPLVCPISSHPWFGCSPSIVLPSHEEIIKDVLNKCIREFRNLQTNIDILVELSAVRPPAFGDQIPMILDASRVVAQSKPIDRSVLVNSDWDQPNQHADDLIARIKEFQGIRRAILLKIKGDILEWDIASFLKQYESLSNKTFKIFYAQYRHLRRQILQMYHGHPRLRDIQIIADLVQLDKCVYLRSVIRKSQEKGQALFGSLWQGEESDHEALQRFSEWIVPFRGYLVEQVLAEKAVDMVIQGVSPEPILKAADILSNSYKDLGILLARLANQVKADYEAIFGRPIGVVLFLDLISRLKLWESEIPRLQRWSQYVAMRNQCLQTIAAPLIPEIEKDQLEAGDLLPGFTGNFADDMLAVVFAERPVLAAFVGDLHERKINRFVDLDKKLIIHNRQRLIQKLLQERPSIYEGVSPGSEIGILRSEFNRKRGHMPIRKLMSQAGSLIQKIKPCFMMSPLSIAQFLDPKTTRFDVIIYDEASQVRPEDALGALLRGNQVTVIGDVRQLPPTAFFDHLIVDDIEEDQDFDNSHVDTESILHQCRRCFPTKMLRWHYRSRHESLVAVSNKQFYNNRLLLYPSPIRQSEDLGLHLVYLPHTIYERGAGQTNRIEAKTIAEKAVEHYRQHPHKSLGIGAFNIRQQQAILEEVELQLSQNPEMEEYFKSDRFEHFFVKNLETIQGDERDVIFISVGYGFDKSGKLTLNFGPLNNAGGERRLNVLITRAREKCIVFSNFKAQDLHLDAAAPVGLKSLKLFLDFAEHHNLKADEEDKINSDLELSFEDSVYAFLRECGYDVRKQIGCAGFRVDLAILDAQSPGNYLLGIECDGAKYHLSPVARDRDRLRQQILESLGWHIYRIWSTDWYRNRKECQQGLIDDIEKRKVEKERPSMPVARKGKEQPFSAPAEEVKPSMVENHQTNENSTPFDLVVDYQMCANFPQVNPWVERPEVDIKELAKIVTQVVEVEGPVHFEEVIRRIRTFWGLNRSGGRVRDSILEAIASARNYKLIRIKDEFLWPVKEAALVVRRRDIDPPPKIELICDEEITAAVELVLKTQYATLPDDLAIQTSRLLGIKLTSDKTANRIKSLIYQLIEDNRLQKMSNGMINLVED